MIGIVGDVHSYDFLLDKVDVLLINDKVVTTKNYISSYVGNKKYKVSLKSFFQINETITEKIYNEVLGLIQKNKSKNVLDLYCGTGTIGIYIADYVDNVLGIEVVKDAVVDANFNKKLNNSKNISFIAGKVEDKINDVGIDFDTIIIDPPRSGLDKVVIQTILKINPKNIIYISCNPISLVRDIKLLINNYDIDYVKPFDMFPNTYHCEAIAVLERK